MNELRTGLLVIALGVVFVSSLAFGCGLLTGFILWGL
jgi:hypothetical protein